MAKGTDSIIKRCAAQLMRPIVQFCLARGIRFQDFIEIAKKVFVDEGVNILDKSHQTTISVSKLCAMTGLQRPEIIRLKSQKSHAPDKDFIARVVGQWLDDKRFLDHSGKPRILTTSGSNSEFRKLVFSVSKNLNPHTVLFELTRLHIVSTQDERASLIQTAHLSTGDTLKTIQMATNDACDLLIAGQENAFLTHEPVNLHAKTEYDNISDEEIPAIREWILELGKRVHREIRAYLAKKDRDINPKKRAGLGRNRVIIGTFSRVEPKVGSKEEK